MSRNGNLIRDPRCVTFAVAYSPLVGCPRFEDRPIGRAIGSRHDDEDSTETRSLSPEWAAGAQFGDSAAAWGSPPTALAG